MLRGIVLRAIILSVVKVYKAVRLFRIMEAVGDIQLQATGPQAQKVMSLRVQMV
ncbi:hypothetical protein D3C75_1145610 [compost metagenome]